MPESAPAPERRGILLLARAGWEAGPHRVARAAVVLAILLLPLTARAADTPLGGRLLSLRHWTDGAGFYQQRISLAVSGPAIELPEAGSPDDPVGESAGDATIEVFTGSGGHVTMLAPAAGWQRRESGARLLFQGSRDDAVSRIELRSSGALRVVTRALGLVLDGYTRAAALRVVLGARRYCVRFQEEDVVRDEPGRFIARGAEASALSDCNDESLFGPCGEAPNCGGACEGDGVCAPDLDFQGCRCILPTDACGGTSPVCNGACSGGEECTSLPGYPYPNCLCVGTEPLCETSGFPTCGGPCGAGLECRPVGSSIGGNTCACQNVSAGCGNLGGACPAGTYCLHGGSGFFLCMPVPCSGGGAFPVCGGTCAEGFECHAWRLASGGMSFCQCTPAPVALCGLDSPGVDCPAGEFCEVSIDGSGTDGTCMAF